MRIRDRRSRNRKIGALKAGTPVVLWLDSPAERVTAPEEALCVTGVCDPWHLLSGASATIVDADDELALLAGVRGIALECVGNGRFAKLAGTASISALRNIFRRAVGGFDYFDPYSGDPISFEEAVAYCKFWRGLIDSNRDIRAAAGFAFWKRSTVSALLWGGADGTPFARKTSAIRRGESVALWRSRTSASAIASIERRGARLVEVEDGFIRSAGLGADCIPPLSIVVDRLGAHFDAKRPSELEQLLQNHTFSSDILDRARELRRLIVRSGVSKYECGRHSLRRRVQGKIHLLVTGQVEDDRAVICGGAGLTSNLELLQRVRAHRPDAHIMYKPHPDVEAGHRVGAIRPDLCLSLADEIVSNEPISALLDLADEVHVNTSLAGFEALLREKRVTTHGVPFYAGWGLTEDLGPVPPRRSARRTLDELVAAVLLLYPRYLDPVTGLPCPAEVLVRRLAEPQTHRSDGVVVQIRRVQGRLKRGLAALRGTR
jgi:capsular polysaccharide export protein